MSAQAEAAKASDRFHLVGHVLEGKFEIERVVAQGGFGVVYRGTHRGLGRAVALKVLKFPEEYAESVRAHFFERFALEARILASLDHPGVVRVLDYDVSPMPSGETAPWMALEWLTGPTLKDYLASLKGREGGLAPARALALLRPVFEAVAYAHDKGIAHRDLTPANLMLDASDRGPSLRLLDFGIAKIMDDAEDVGSGYTQTRSPFASFSPRYAAPEQVSRTRTGPWTDVHGLGLLVTHLLTARQPYAGASDDALWAEVFSPSRPTPARFGVDVGPWEAVLARAVALKPEHRYPHARELLEALEGTLQGASRPHVGPLPVESPVAESGPVEPAVVTAPRPSERREEGGAGRARLVGSAVFAAASLALMLFVLRGAVAPSGAAGRTQREAAPTALEARPEGPLPGLVPSTQRLAPAGSGDASPSSGTLPSGTARGAGREAVVARGARRREVRRVAVTRVETAPVGTVVVEAPRPPERPVETAPGSLPRRLHAPVREYE